MSQPTSPRRANLTTSRTRFESTPKQASSPRGASGAGGTEAEKRTALDAATRGDLDLLSAYVPGHFKEHDEVARQALHKAANYGNVRTNQSASDDVTKHNQRDKADRRALKQHSRHLSIVAYLIDDAHVDKDAVDKVTRKTALHYACEKGKLDIVDYLVNEAQVDVALIDREGHSALDAAVLAGQQEAVHIITDRLIQAAAKQGADDCRPALEAVEKERDAALAEVARERGVKETALAMAENEALEKREVLAELGAERARRQRAEASIEELREETKVLASIITAHEEEAELWRQAKAEQTPAPCPAPVSPVSVPPAQVVMDLPVPPPKVEVVKQVEVALPIPAPSSPSSMSEEGGQVGRSAPAVELLRSQLDKERKWRAEAEADREAIQRKLREVEGRLATEAARWDEHRSRLEQDVARLQAALESERAELAEAREALQSMVVAQEAARAAQEAAANEVVTGFVLKQKQHSLGRDTWEPRFLVAQQGKLRYFNSDKEYLATPRSPRSGSSSGTKVVDLPRSTAAVLPSDDLIFIVRPNDATQEGEGSTAAPSSPTSGSGQMLWFRCPDRPARDAWLRSLRAQGCSVSDHAVIGTLPTQGSTRSFRHASTSLQGGEG